MIVRSPALLILLACLAAAGAHAAPSYGERDDVRGFVAEMVERHGFEADRLLALFHKAHPDPAVIKAIQPPADPGSRSWRAYRDRFVEPRRIARGLDFWQRHAASLAHAEATRGVPAAIVVAILGVETFYGRHTGRFHAFNALTNLAFDHPPRAELFRRELEALLLLARDERRDPWSYKSSYAGAIGLPQFLPSSVRGYAVDFDRDGRIDLAASPDDAIGSVARFLAEHGWRGGEAIAHAVKVSGGDTPNSPAALIAEGIRPARLPSELAGFGVDTDGAPELPAALIDLATPEHPTEYRLGFNNFFVITRYNRSSFYAAAVMDLAEALRAARP
ncbi:MAG: lytic murein transglycosylase B [Rhodocyclaceae bacterium]|jgi:membrane-bound lytic murein transglycosylase B|nr:lytic murein transglycosylase B [Rhodocyclaceae bacterium]MBK6555575.1 lytic murein transglycosylase B [Rhodocyclaceae bacterium]MBK9312574.1 lytic murein transglycosylase B [Rhodocyclaceae bacterium]